MGRKREICKIAVLCIVLFFAVYARADKACLIVNSYHKGYAWSDPITESISHNLRMQCKVQVEYLNSKGTEKLDYQKKAKQISDTIKKGSVDVVILLDDNALKEVYLPYFTDSNIPFIAVGINWSAKDYHIDDKQNITYMLEVMPIVSIFGSILSVVKAEGKVKVAYLDGDTYTARKNSSYIGKILKKLNIQYSAHIVSDFNQWLAQLEQLQRENHIVILQNHAGIANWNQEIAMERSYSTINADCLTFTFNFWMMEYAMVGFIKIPHEHSKFAYQSAKAVLSGRNVKSIFPDRNKHTSRYVHTDYLQRTYYQLEHFFYR